jgi:hypothetical protein
VAAVDFESFFDLSFPLEPPESFLDDESPEDPEELSDFEDESDFVDESVFVGESALFPLPAESPPDESLEELFPLPFEPFRESVL